MRMVPLGEVATITMGQAPAGDSYNASGEGVPLIAGAGDFKNGRIKVGKSTTAPTKFSAPGDIVLSIRASIGAKVWSDGIYCLGRGVAGIKANAELSADYLWHWLGASEQTLTSKGRGATFLQVNRDDISEMKIPLPPLDEQRRIAAILDQADTLRTQRRAQLAHLDALPQTIFHDMVSSTSVDRIALGDLFKFNSGRFLPAKSQQRGPYPVYGGNGINGFHAEKMYSERQIVIGRVGAYCGAVHLTTGAAWVTDNAIVASPLTQEIPLEFLTESLRAAKLNQYKSQSGQPLISGSRLKGVTVPIPDNKYQEEFSCITRKAAIAAERVKAGASSLDNLFASLQSRGFRGEL